MASVTFVPSTDDKLLTWSTTFKTILSADFAAYSFTSAQAAQYAAAHDAFAAAVAVVAVPSTRSKISIAAKESKKRDLVFLARGFGGMIQRNPGLSDEMKLAIGVTVRKPPTPRPIPATKPKLTVDRVDGWTMELSATEAGSARKNRKPKDAAGIMLFSCVGVGDIVPMDLSKYRFEGSSTRTVFTVQVDPTVAPGSPIYFVAFWFNSRQQSGPACAPVKTYVQYGAMNKAA